VLAACCFCCAPVILVALPFAAVAFTLAHRDRKRMEAGAMDPAGEFQAAPSAEERKSTLTGGRKWRQPHGTSPGGADRSR
jgi:hypothetical protein